jgi:hypothetical protein
MKTSRTERFSKALSIADVLILGGVGISFSSWGGRFNLGLLSLLGFAGFYQVIRSFFESPSESEQYFMRAPEHQFLKCIDDGYHEKSHGALALALVGIPLILITVVMRMAGLVVMLVVIGPIYLAIEKLFWQKKSGTKAPKQ